MHHGGAIVPQILRFTSLRGLRRGLTSTIRLLTATDRLLVLVEFTVTFLGDFNILLCAFIYPRSWLLSHPFLLRAIGLEVSSLC
jgi:hypothetical protein